jgi:triacylglycerol lipase
MNAAINADDRTSSMVMLVVKRIISCLLLVLAVNQVFLFACFTLPSGVADVLLKILIGLCLSIFFIVYNCKPLTRSTKQLPKPLRRLNRSHELLLTAAVLFLMQVVVTCVLFVVFLRGLVSFPYCIEISVINFVSSLLLTYIVAINGLIRSFVASKQMSIVFRVVLFFVWWVPVVNIVCAFIASRIVDNEFKGGRRKYYLNISRAGQQVCKTKYPILMVHGIFFRDWDIFNYWGRIPKELEANGATIFYGGHQSALPVEESAQELKQKIQEIIAQTGCEKVNVIAHSKGGIDMRYAISQLGMGQYVASLTTVNTPHEGSDLAGKLLTMAPDTMVTTVGKTYSSIFSRLGDVKCDFAGSVNELTAARAKELNAIMPDDPGVYYQSIGSMMKSWKSAPFPLNVGYSIIKPIGGDNDGLVATRSMEWGNFLGIMTGSGRRGVSHGDMIDLSRRDIPGFDVLETYVGLVAGLKGKGF